MFQNENFKTMQKIINSFKLNYDIKEMLVESK